MASRMSASARSGTTSQTIRSITSFETPAIAARSCSSVRTAGAGEAGSASAGEIETETAAASSGTGSDNGAKGAAGTSGAGDDSVKSAKTVSGGNTASSARAMSPKAFSSTGSAGSEKSGSGGGTAASSSNSNSCSSTGTHWEPLSCGDTSAVVASVTSSASYSSLTIAKTSGSKTAEGEAVMAGGASGISGSAAGVKALHIFIGAAGCCPTNGGGVVSAGDASAAF